MRSPPVSPPLSVLLTVAGFPPRASAHFLISSWFVVVLDDAPAINASIQTITSDWRYPPVPLSLQVRAKSLLPRRYFTTREQLNHALIKGRDILRAAAADPVPVAHQLLVYPPGASIANIVLDRVIARQRPALGKACRDQQPGAMADDGNRSPAVINLAHKVLSLWLHPQRIGIERATGQQDSVKISGIRLVQRHIHGEGVCLHIVIHTLHLAGLGRYDLCGGPDLIQRLFGFSQFYLFKIVCHENGNAHSLYCISLHVAPFYLH